MDGMTILAISSIILASWTYYLSSRNWKLEKSAKS